MAYSGREITEGHPVLAADLRLQFMDRAQETVGRQPARDGIALQKGAIDLLRLGGDDAVKSDRIGLGFLLAVRDLSAWLACLRRRASGVRAAGQG